MRIVFLAAALATLSGCGTLPQKPANLFGEWGGQGVGLVVEGGLGTVSYDCARGTIDQTIAPGPDQRFSASGTHMAGQGGPVRVGQIFTTQRAEYRGSVEGETMILTVTLDDGEMLGPFTLVRGQPPVLNRCL